MNPITGLLYALGGLTVVFAGFWGRAFNAARRLAVAGGAPATDARMPTAGMGRRGRAHQLPRHAGYRIVRDDNVVVFRFFKMVPDRVIPARSTPATRSRP